MYTELGIQPSALAVAKHYGSLLTGFVLDNIDRAQAEAVLAMGVQLLVTNTMMTTSAERYRLAQDVIEFGSKLTR
jgi:LPPG:FO 2-phospho-L-lactate transferase